MPLWPRTCCNPILRREPSKVHLTSAHPSSLKMSTQSTPSSSSTTPPEDFKVIVRQEEDRLRKMHPTPEDIPGCMTVFDDFLKCNRTSSLFTSPSSILQTTSCKFSLCIARNVPSPRQPIPLPLALRPIRPMHLQTPRLQILHVDSAARA